ncbi:hypothetical protein CC80DRAFT_87300 [Byssothecium circinans]|uniref:GPI anchored serine-threonine rich protein n=1 Tax=Byssothecium circinans TaxID=147558 RepID=A0A6A5TSD9_9PLEO|nr:hypothetical protein CC80DRAFT_87300 [Byssothecium circinans]
MRFFAAFAVLSASLAAAQSTSAASAAPSSGVCAMNIVENCVDQYKKRVDGCNAKPNDFICLCSEYQNYLTCYNNCPSSPDRSPIQNSATQYCEAAKPLQASLSSVAATAVKTSASTSATGATSSGASATSAMASASGFANPSGAAEALNIPMSGAFALMLGVAGLL